MRRHSTSSGRPASCRPRPSWTTRFKNSYDRIKVTATDSDGLSASIDVTITVTNVDEAPNIDGE